MREFKDIILELRKSCDMSQEELSKLIGMSKSSIAMWETGKRIPSSDVFEALADFFNVDIDYLYGRTNVKRKIIFDEFGDMYSSSPVKIPVLGRVAAGIPLTAVENIIDYEEISTEMASDGEYFALQIKGDSMEPRIKNGDVVIVRKQDDADDGDTVIALVNGSDAVCKRLKKYADKIGLISNNAAYEPMFFDDEEIKSKPVRIIGKVKELRAKF